MTREELIEKVVAITEADTYSCLTNASAGAAIDIVLEEAAKVADEWKVSIYRPSIAEAIRLLKGESDDRL